MPGYEHDGQIKKARALADSQVLAKLSNEPILRARALPASREMSSVSNQRFLHNASRGSPLLNWYEKSKKKKLWPSPGDI
jgi:hypothetical protein